MKFDLYLTCTYGNDKILKLQQKVAIRKTLTGEFNTMADETIQMWDPSASFFIS